MSADPILRVVDPGFGMAIHDQGRHGWRRFGLPQGGAMDDHAAAAANRLLQNAPWAPVIECLWQGGKIEALASVWIALAGADTLANFPRWRALQLKAGEVLTMPHNQGGVWTYVAVEGGFLAPHWFDSASVLPSAGMGGPLRRGDLLFRQPAEPRFSLPPGVRGRVSSIDDQRDYTVPPPIRVWPGPQSDWFDPTAVDRFFGTAWVVGSQSNRVGYRLEGPPIPCPDRELISEPVRVGSIQIPPSGQPLVLLRDGPTIGGYPKIGLIHHDDISWLVQTRPGAPIRFDLATP